MNYLFSILITLFITSCGLFHPKDSYSSHEKESLCNKISQKVSRLMLYEAGLIPFGSGGQAMDKIKKLTLLFECRKSLTIESARSLLIKSVDTFVKAVNDEEKIHPYLNNFPFEVRNVEIKIFIQQSDGSSFGDNKLAIASCSGGILKYKIEPKLALIYEESYAEAVEKLKEQTQ